LSVVFVVPLAVLKDAFDPYNAPSSRCSPAVRGSSIARLRAGGHAGALGAVDAGQGIAPQDCRVLVAKELLRVDTAGSPPPAGRTLELHYACEPGLYRWFVDLLPVDFHSEYA
jgi:hypothetical protein